MACPQSISLAQSILRLWTRCTWESNHLFPLNLIRSTTELLTSSNVLALLCSRTILYRVMHKNSSSVQTFMMPLDRCQTYVRFLLQVQILRHFGSITNHSPILSPAPSDV